MSGIAGWRHFAVRPAGMSGLGLVAWQGPVVMRHEAKEALSLPVSLKIGHWQLVLRKIREYWEIDSRGSALICGQEDRHSELECRF